MSLLLATPAIFHKALGGGGAVSVSPVGFVGDQAIGGTSTGYTYAGASLGSSANGDVFLAMGSKQAGDITSCTIDGVTADELAAFTSGGETVQFWRATGVTNSTGDIVLTWASASVATLNGYVWRVDGYQLGTGNTPYASNGATPTLNSTDCSVNTLTDGAILGLGWSYAAIDWTAGLTEESTSPSTMGTGDECIAGSALVSSGETPRTVTATHTSTYGMAGAISLEPA